MCVATDGSPTIFNNFRSRLYSIYHTHALEACLAYLPYEESGGHQKYGQVDCHRGLKIVILEECGGVGHQQQEEGGEVGGQQLVGQPPLEHYLHLQTVRRCI